MKLHSIVQIAVVVSLVITALEFYEDAAGLSAFVWQGISVAMIGLLILSTLRERRNADSADVSGTADVSGESGTSGGSETKEG